MSIYKNIFNIPYNRKDEFKKMGGIWDSVKKRWYISNSIKILRKLLKFLVISKIITD